MQRSTSRFWFILMLVVLISSFGVRETHADANDIELVSQHIIVSLLPDSPEGRRSSQEAAEQASRTMQTDGSWGDIAYSDLNPTNWKATEHLARVDSMTRGYCISGQPLFHNQALKAQILLSLSYWLGHDYQNPNWWWNQINVPKRIGQIMLLMKNDLPVDLKNKSAAIVQRSKLSMTGSNLVWVAGNQIMLGCATDDAGIIQAAFARMYEEINLDPQKRDSLRPDYSFQQHGKQLYSGGYGNSFSADLARFIVYGWGTQFQISTPKLQIFIDFLLEGQQWTMRGSHADYSTMGRYITRPVSETAPPYQLAPQGTQPGPLPETPLGKLAALPVPRQIELAALARRLGGAPDTVPLTGNRSFWESDYMAHQRPAYLATVKLLSNRTQNGEVVNGEGLRSQFLSYGATFLYQTGNEYDNIFPVWEWRHVPGTTIEQQPGVLGPLDAKTVGVKGKTSFVGSASDGKYGLAVQDLSEGNVTGHKSWFFFDDGFFALGSELSCPTPNTLITTVNQCLLQSNVLTDNQTVPLSAGLHVLNNARWVWQNGVAYVFPEGGIVEVTNQAQTGRWSEIGAGSSAPVTKNVFDLGLNHGTNVAGARYVYGVLPGCTPQEIMRRSAAYEILQNTADIQAVTNLKAGLTEAAFWKAGALKIPTGLRLSVDQPCLLLWQKFADGSSRLTVANPARRPLRVQVSVNGHFTGEGCVIRGEETLVTMDLPGDAVAGKSVICVLTPAP